MSDDAEVTEINIDPNAGCQVTEVVTRILLTLRDAGYTDQALLEGAFVSSAIAFSHLAIGQKLPHLSEKTLGKWALALAKKMLVVATEDAKSNLGFQQN